MENTVEPVVATGIEDALSGLTARERSFVHALMRGEDLESAARKGSDAKKRVGAAAVRLLGKPRVRAAIIKIAPLLADRQLAARLLEPYIFERLAELALQGKPTPATSAARAILKMAGDAPRPVLVKQERPWVDGRLREPGPRTARPRVEPELEPKPLVLPLDDEDAE